MYCQWAKVTRYRRGTKPSDHLSSTSRPAVRRTGRASVLVQPGPMELLEFVFNFDQLLNRLDSDSDQPICQCGEIAGVAGEDHPAASTHRDGHHGGVDVVVRPAARSGQQVSDPPGQMPVRVGNLDPGRAIQVRIDHLVVSATSILSASTAAGTTTSAST